MIINKVAIGNFQESFIESRFKNKVNIIYSNDNNKGKTLLLQGLMYSIGNNPIFPSGFKYKEYYFYSLIEINEQKYEFLRKDKSIIIKTNKTFSIIESLSELKYHINKNIFSIPKIVKGNEDKLVDLSLFYQIFFVGQDDRNTSNIFNKGYYNKKDFLNMLFVLNGSKQTNMDDVEIETIRSAIRDKKSEINKLNKQLKFSKKNPQISQESISYVDKEKYEQQKKEIESLHKEIGKFRNKRTRETDRLFKLKTLLSELRSLNNKIEIGKVKCADCQSERILYTNNDLSFELSNSIVRNNIISSIQQQIDLKKEIIQEINDDLDAEMNKKTKLLSEIPSDVQDLFAFGNEIISDEEYGNKMLLLKAEIAVLEDQIKNINDIDEDAKNRNKLLLDSISTTMDKYYQMIDNDGNLRLDNLFTKNDENYSGSDSQEFYFCKTIALLDILKHDFPIIFDSYRSGELFSNKEIRMLEIFNDSKSQVIISSTLKEEEYDKPKYNENVFNIIDYSSHQNNKLLNENSNQEFLEILDSFSIADIETTI